MNLRAYALRFNKSDKYVALVFLLERIKMKNKSTFTYKVHDKYKDYVYHEEIKIMASDELSAYKILSAYTGHAKFFYLLEKTNVEQARNN